MYMRMEAQYCSADTQPERELGGWFAVPGDVDDFIFWDEDAPCSER